jgi:hypothetical protein
MGGGCFGVKFFYDLKPIEGGHVIFILTAALLDLGKRSQAQSAKLSQYFSSGNHNQL